MDALRRALIAQGNTGRRLAVAVISLCVLALILLPVTAGGEQPGIGAEVMLRHGVWTVISVDKGSTAALTGLRVGNVIISVDGTVPRYRSLFDPGLHLDGSHIWTVLQQGVLRVLRPNPHRVSWSTRAEPMLLLLIAVGFWLGATFVQLLQPRNELAGRLYWLSLSMAFALALNNPAADNIAWAKVCEVGAFAILPAQFLSFCLRLASGAQPQKWMVIVVRSLFVAGFVLGCWYLVAGLVWSSLYDVLSAALLLLLALAFLGGLIALAHGARRARSPLVRQRVVIVLLGIAAAVLPLTVLCMIPTIAGRPPVVQPQMAALSMVALPVSLAYAILRYQLLDIRVVLHRTVVYGVMTALLAGCYAVLLHWLSAVDLNLYQTHLSLLGLGFFALVSMTFMPLRQRVILLVDHFMFHDRYDYAGTLQRLGASLASVQPVDQVLTELVNSLERAMNLTGSAVIVRGVSGEPAMRAASRAYQDPASMQGPLSRVPTALPEGVMDDSGGYWQPLRAHNTHFGLLYLGPKRSGAGFSARDLRLVATLAGEAALAMANGVLVEQLEEKVTELRLMYDRLVIAQGEDRKHLARDVHDNVLQPVLHVLRLSAALATAKRGDTAKLTTRLQALAEQSHEAAHALRGLCQGLYPAELTDLGLVAALRDRARLISRDQPVTVRVVAPECREALRLPVDLEYTLFRIAQEA
ncbi:MAG: histidine kinase, partial [Chloroflexota bacterium]